MTESDTLAEPENNTFVVWFDRNDDPFAVFYREDNYADGDDRWINTDQFNGNDGDPLSWSELCAEMAGMKGPHLLTLVRSESLAVKP